jgi:polar amino acid transport system substrate-binding protein
MATAPRRAIIALIVLMSVIAALCVWRNLRPRPPTIAFPYEVLRIGIDPSYPPFAVHNGQEVVGIDIDVGNAIGAALDIPVQFVLTGFDGAYDALATDRVDILISALVVNPLRTQEVRYTQPYFDNGLVLVSPLDAPLAGMAELGGRRLAVEFGGTADHEARLWQRRSAVFELHPYELPTYALDAVRFAQADAALVDATTYRLYQREHADWQAQAHYITSSPYAIAVRLDRDLTWQAVQATLERLSADGTLTQILQKWL